MTHLIRTLLAGLAWTAVAPAVMAAAAAPAPAGKPTYALIHACTGGAQDCSIPSGGLILASDGNFYGTSEGGGETADCINCGTVFRMSPDGTLTIIHAFSAAEGGLPIGGLVQASDGNLYGTTSMSPDQAAQNGTVFRISLDGQYQLLHVFAGRPSEGAVPATAMIQGKDGFLYGTTPHGGATGTGTVFRISMKGDFTNLFSFDPGAIGFNGATPFGGLLQGSDGHLWGTTTQGGTNPRCHVARGCGTVFTLPVDGSYVPAWFSFSDATGVEPFGTLLQARDGSLYGTTSAGGAMADCGGLGCGTIFRFTADRGIEAIAHRFKPGQGAFVWGGLMQATDGNLYGTAYQGGNQDACADIDGCGTLFRLTPAGGFKVLHVFQGTPDGSGPAAALVQGRDSALYGTTSYGGYVDAQGLDNGTMFRVDLP
jgi:uncharacterized repeat protein (TIGR03803 family)